MSCVVYTFREERHLVSFVDIMALVKNAKDRKERAQEQLVPSKDLLAFWMLPATMKCTSTAPIRAWLFSPSHSSH